MQRPGRRLVLYLAQPEIILVSHASSNEPTLDQVASAFHAGRYDEARASCERIARARPADGDAQMWLGLISMQQRRWDEAIAAFDAALRVRVEPWSLTNLGHCYTKIGRLADAEYCFSNAARIKPDLVDAQLGLAAVFHGMRRFDDALAAIEAAARLDPAQPHVEVRRGCTLAELGRLDEAQRAFEAAVAGGVPLSYPRLVAFDRATYDAVAGSPPSLPTCDVALAAARHADTRGVVVLSADVHYMRRYGLACVRSVAAHIDAGLLVHVHVYDPDETIVDDVYDAAREAGAQRLAITTERCPYDVEAPQQRKSYYACGRLLRMPEWLERYRLPLLSLDIDTIVERSPAGFFETTVPVDVRLNARHTIDSPWLDIVANVIVAYPTEAARTYFAAVGNYIARYLAVEADPWLLDQTALFCVLKMAQRFGTAPRVEYLADGEAGLWHLGHAYTHLMDDPRFLRYAAS